MYRSRLKKSFSRDRTERSRCKYKKEMFLYIYEKAKKDYYENIDSNNITDSKRLVVEKNLEIGIILVEGSRIIQ